MFSNIQNLEFLPDRGPKTSLPRVIVSLTDAQTGLTNVHMSITVPMFLIVLLQLLKVVIRLLMLQKKMRLNYVIGGSPLLIICMIQAKRIEKYVASLSSLLCYMENCIA
jgi:hypothetical protein